MATRTRTRQRGDLSKAEILEAALALVDEEGLEALSMRRVASSIGVSPMGLYRHVATRDEIVQGIADMALEDIDVELDSGGTWEDQLKAVFTQIHETLLAHPGLIHVLHVQPISAERALDTVEALLGILRGSGFSGEEAVAIVGAVQSYTFGFTVQQRARIGTEEGQHVKRLKALPTSEYPNLLELAGDFGNWTTEQHFEYGLDRLLQGIAAGRKKRQPRRR
jgi:TetR/AcrR family tetracycline transcriptional repressor